MSSIGTGNLGALSLATALAAGQRSDRSASVESVAQKTSEFARRAAALEVSRDVGEFHATEDRDADGRQAWMRQGEAAPEAESDEPAEGTKSAPARPSDPLGRRGGRLDLNV